MVDSEGLISFGIPCCAMKVDKAAYKRMLFIIERYKIKLKCSPEELLDLILEAHDEPVPEVKVLSECCDADVVFQRNSQGAWVWQCAKCGIPTPRRRIDVAAYQPEVSPIGVMVGGAASFSSSTTRDKEEF